MPAVRHMDGREQKFIVPEKVLKVAFPPELEKDEMDGMPAFTSPKEMAETLARMTKKAGKYYSQGGVLAFVDGGGGVWCVPLAVFKTSDRNPIPPDLLRDLQREYGGEASTGMAWKATR